MTIVEDRTAVNVEGTHTVPAGFTMPAGTFRNLLVGALVAAGDDRTLPTLCAVRLEWAECGPVTVASTDRYRLAVGECKPDGSVDVVGDYCAALIDRKDVAEMVKALPRPTVKRDGTAPFVTVTVADGVATVELTEWRGGAVAWSRRVVLVDGEFPKFRSLIPTEFGEVESFACNPGFLADADRIPHSKHAAVRFRFTRQHRRFTRQSRPVVLDYPTDDESPVSWLYLLMPVRLAGPDRQGI